MSAAVEDQFISSRELAKKGIEEVGATLCEGGHCVARSAGSRGLSPARESTTVTSVNHAAIVSSSRRACNG